MPDLVCEWCKSSFYKKPSKVSSRHFCSSTCRKNKTLDSRRRLCQRCKTPFESTVKTQFLCSRECAAAHVSETTTVDNPEYVTNCSWCNNSIRIVPSRKGKHNNFCSSECSEAHIRGFQEKYITKICPECSKEFQTLYRKQATFCSKSCANAGERCYFYGKTPLTKGKPSWNHGLTNETSSKVADIGKKVSVALKRRFLNGESSHYGTNNPNHYLTRKNKQRTIEQLNRYSLASIARVQSGCTQNPKTKKGVHYSTKSLSNIHYKSSYEETYMKFLDQSNNVTSYTYEQVVITYDGCRRYVPDFIVTYEDGTKALVEIKGMHLLHLDSTKRKLQAGKEYADIHNMSFVVVTNNEILKIRKELAYEC